MRAIPAILAALLLAACAPAGAKEMDRERVVEAPDWWMTDLAKASAKAIEEGKPLFVVFRCDP
jgi:hypothetical protein